MSYFTRLDVANRALQHLGVPRIASFTESTRQAREANFAIDKLRRAELQRSVWTFASKRAVMREVVGTTKELAFPTYDNAVAFDLGAVIYDAAGFLWINRRGTVTGTTPGSEGRNPYWVPYFGPAVAQAHSTSVAYIPGDVVYSSGAAYLCIVAHTNHVPANATYWIAVSVNSLDTITALSPGGYERDATTLRKKYRLPANWLRMAPQDPKMASGAHQQVTAGMAYNDWEVEEPYLYTADTSPFVLRFVADATDVSTMHPLFCEVWAARLAIELSDPLTQNPDKLQNVAGLYQRYTDAAQLVNAIEAGTTEGEPSSAPPQQQGR